jgi:hypothetical protein
MTRLQLSQKILLICFDVEEKNPIGQKDVKIAYGQNPKCRHTFLNFPLFPLTIVINKRLFLTIQDFSYFYEAPHFKSPVTFIILSNTSEYLVIYFLIDLVTL